MEKTIRKIAEIKAPNYLSNIIYLFKKEFVLNLIKDYDKTADNHA